MEDQDILDSQQGLRLEDVDQGFALQPHQVERLPSLVSDSDIVLETIRKGMGLASNVAGDLEELGDSSMLESLENMVKECIDMERAINNQKLAFMKLRSDVTERHLDVGDGLSRFDDYYSQDMQTYNTKTDKEKYHQHEKYTEFKETVWMVKNPDTTMPPLDGDSNEGNDDDEDDVVIASTKKSLKCPLTTTWFETPVTSKTCKHTFSKEAIMGLILRSSMQAVECPMPGCRVVFDRTSFYEDTLMERMVNKAKQAEANNARSEQFHDVG
ncbi:zinc-finger of the MIZ type in Nse subunit-domain-containing protein [Chlamydoabsidia padenii]|nr:zinc-finger of the MIZ type in Nse subunit-domain-containing protein [Chlamydoabsidia padenii]